MANVWLERLQNVEDLPGYNKNKIRNQCEMYDEEQFRRRQIKDGFRDILNMIEKHISAHNQRGNPILQISSSYWHCVKRVRFSKRVETYVTYLNRLQVALLSKYPKPLLD